MGELFSPYDTANYLTSEEDRALYLEACLDEGDAELVVHALRTIERARNQHNDMDSATLDNLAQLVSSDHVSVESLLKAIKALGLHLHVQPSRA
ncbi:MAG: transcriptional regulator [Magnetococcales bacterium]|nr:transcriptional regulator [Magnetococcales bacterium]NGZ25765.1 transcriptional regulator [Magnetococcales bacterium]